MFSEVFVIYTFLYQTLRTFTNILSQRCVSTALHFTNNFIFKFICFLQVVMRCWYTPFLYQFIKNILETVSPNLFEHIVYDFTSITLRKTDHSIILCILENIGTGSGSGRKIKWIFFPGSKFLHFNFVVQKDDIVGKTKHWTIFVTHFTIDPYKSQFHFLYIFRNVPMFHLNWQKNYFVWAKRLNGSTQFTYCTAKFNYFQS